MRYYVYALIDPTNGNKPFYIGKGLDNRLQSHFKEASVYNKNDTIIGCDTSSIIVHAQEDNNELPNLSPKIKKLNELSEKGYNHTHIARIIARNLNESTALAIEAFLIKNVYGIENLTNRVEGEHSERFRPNNIWDYIEGFDQKSAYGKFILEEIDHKLGKYYVYVLCNPETREVFYVGKGTRNRIMNHFQQAKDIEDPENEAERLRIINELLGHGFKPYDIGRVVARVDDEEHAFAIEALLIKFVFGIKFITNIQPGHQSGYFRAKDDWEKRIGFDLPFIINPGARADRSEKLDLMIGEGLDLPLMEVKAAFPKLNFDAPKILDSSELGIEANVGNNTTESGARIKIFIRIKKIQVELRWRKKDQRKWIIRHFSKLHAYPLRRSDDVFFPDKWRGSENMTSDVGEAIRRVRLLLEIVSAKSRKELSLEALTLLDGLPENRI